MDTEFTRRFKNLWREKEKGDGEAATRTHSHQFEGQSQEKRVARSHVQREQRIKVGVIGTEKKKDKVILRIQTVHIILKVSAKREV